jgi:hypothetical protein
VPVGEPNPVFTDVRLRATVSAFPDMPTLGGGGPTLSNNDAFLAIRGNGASAYVLAFDHLSGELDLVLSQGGNVSALPDIPGGDPSTGVLLNFDPTKSYVLEMTAVDQTIRGAIFDLGNTTPLLSLGTTDSVFSEGWSGVGAAVNDNDGIGGEGGPGRTPVAVIFDDVSSVVFIASDLTGNGFVDFQDLTILLANWNKIVAADQGNLVEAGSTPVDFADLTTLLADWTGPGPAGSPQAAQAVPEPSSGMLVLLAAACLGAIRRRRK